MKCDICDKEIVGKAYLRKDVDADGKEIPNAWVILCEKCRREWDDWDSTMVKLKDAEIYAKQADFEYQNSANEPRDSMNEIFKVPSKGKPIYRITIHEFERGKGYMIIKDLALKQTLYLIGDLEKLRRVKLSFEL
ncbi:MAG: hypothetical protein DRJ31_06210 [Candidatus Methanomethylicota archaeon]|uniref:Uncharacterized protein n=1 Tax=Thermoproteota archaeon TaxID=2056631 RepID=A0A497EQQ5_9CREN|nr:MAG: hypothetical protein DRJ31_06210 [Candidatus Verstraetearchaeota archaeon]